MEHAHQSGLTGSKPAAPERNGDSNLKNALNDRVIQRVAEAKLQAAMERGEFENLPGFGQPFEFDELAYDPHWWIRRKLKREQLVQLQPGADPAS